MTVDERIAHWEAAELPEGITEAERRERLEYRELLKAMCLDPEIGDAFFINCFCVTFDPRPAEGASTPIGHVFFLLWESQERAAREFGQAMDRGEDCGGEKSRDQGMTWIVLALIIKRWLLTPGFNALIGAMTELLLDNEKSPSTLFWKIKCILDYLPDWLLPKGFSWEKHHTWANVVNPETGASIQGRAPTERFPVGDRQSVIYYDDWAQWEKGAEAWENAAATTNCRLATWTANGLNHAWELRFGKGRFENVKVKIVNIHWRTDPRKSRVAYDEERGYEYNVWLREMVGDALEPRPKGLPGKISLNQFLKDYEFTYEVSQKGLIYINQIKHARRGKFPRDSRLPLGTGWDYGRSDHTVILWFQYDYINLRFRFIDMLVRTGQKASYYVPFVKGKEDEFEVLEHEKDYTPQDWEIIRRHTRWQSASPATGKREVVYHYHYGDPSGKKRDVASNRSAVEVLSDHGIVVEDTDNNDAKSYQGRIEAARYLLYHSDFDEEFCEPLLQALMRYKWDKTGTKPEHIDETADICAAFEYIAVNVVPDLKDAIALSEKAASLPEGFGDDIAVFAIGMPEAELEAMKKETRKALLTAEILEGAGIGGGYYPHPSDSPAGY